jgi:hypothetical protein
MISSNTHNEITPHYDQKENIQDDNLLKISNGDSINFFNPQPSENITNLHNYTVRVEINLTVYLGGVWLKVFSTDVQNPEMDWSLMNQEGITDIWNITIDPIDFPNYQFYNFSVKTKINAFDWFYNYTIASMNNTSPLIDFINPINLELITKFHNLNINVSINDTQDHPVKMVKMMIYETIPSSPILDWVDMYNQTNGYYNYTINPIDYDNSDYKIRINTSDEKDWGINEITIKINNTQPTIEYITPTDLDVITEEGLLTINASISDLEGDNILTANFLLYSGNPNNPLIDWTPMDEDNGYYNYSFNPLDLDNGDYTIRVNASDEKGFNYLEILITINIDRSEPLPNNDNDDDNTDTSEGFNIWIPIISGIVSAIAGIFVKIAYNKSKKNKEALKKIPLVIKGKISPKSSAKSDIKKDMMKLEKAKFEWDDSEDRAIKTKIKPKTKSISPLTPIPIPLTSQEKEEIEKAEKEISVEKRQFICIVHKGIIDGSIYICPNCQTQYCSRCAETLQSKKEKCWSCNSPINIKKSNL